MLPWVDIVTNKQVLLTRPSHRRMLYLMAILTCPKNQDPGSGSEVERATTSTALTFGEPVTCECWTAECYASK